MSQIEVLHMANKKHPVLESPTLASLAINQIELDKVRDLQYTQFIDYYMI